MIIVSLQQVYNTLDIADNIIYHKMENIENLTCQVYDKRIIGCEKHFYNFTVAEIVGLALQFATQNCLGCYSNLNYSSKFHAEVAHLPHIKLRTLYTLIIIL